MMVAIALCASPGPLISDEGTAWNPLDWPREYALTDGNHLMLYQPQIERWSEEGQLRATAVVEYGSGSGENAVLGTIIFDAVARTDLISNLVEVSEISLLEGAFADYSFKEAKVFVARLSSVFPKRIVTSIDQVVTGIRRAGNVTAQGEEIDPKQIVFAESPGLLVHLDGDPKWEAIEDGEVEQLANASFNLLRLSRRQTIYLFAGHLCLEAASLEGPWTAVTKVPKALRRLARSDESWRAVEDWIEGWGEPRKETPRVVVVQEPTEMVVLQGAPVTEPVEDTALLWVTNTDEDLFVDPATERRYLLAGGIWYRSDSWSGPWKPTTEPLPGDFAEIPKDHPKASVRGYVPGTAEHLETAVRNRLEQQANLAGVGETGDLQAYVSRGENNLYAGLDGRVYRRDPEVWSVLADGVWSEFLPPPEPEKDPATGKIRWSRQMMREANQRRVWNLLEWDRISRQRGTELALASAEHQSKRNEN